MTTIPRDIAERPAGSVVSACGHLFVLTLRRQLFSRQTLVCLGLVGLCTLIVFTWSQQTSLSAKRLAEFFLVPIYVGFLVPIFAISYGASGIGGEREDRTLIYLLITPIPRALLYLTKALATLALVAAWTAGSLLVLCLLAGSYGRQMFPVALPACVLGSLVYAGLFLLLGAAFRHGTIISLAYWFFLEVLFGAMPGIIKRVTVVYYMKCMIYDAGTEFRLAPLSRVQQEMFLAIPGSTALTVLSCALAVLLALGALVLSSREYSELG